MGVMDKKYCTHDNLDLDLIERWEGGDDSGGLELIVTCADCGEDCLDNDWIIDNFKLILKGNI